jgi:hypothetical protein
MVTGEQMDGWIVVFSRVQLGDIYIIVVGGGQSAGRSLVDWRVVVRMIIIGQQEQHQPQEGCSWTCDGQCVHKADGCPEENICEGKYHDEVLD